METFLGAFFGLLAIIIVLILLLNDTFDFDNLGKTEVFTRDYKGEIISVNFEQPKWITWTYALAQIGFWMYAIVILVILVVRNLF